MRDRLTGAYFERLYESDPDPWSFESSAYERAKYERTLRTLSGRRIRSALEVGCSIGVFTELLAPHCEELLAVDVSRRAVAAARERLRGSSNVRVEKRTVPEDLPDGPFDLVVCSEVLYYLPEALMLQTQRELESRLAPGGALLAVHWRPQTRTYPLLGDEVHDLLLEHTRLGSVERIVEPEYRLDLLEDQDAAE